MRLILNRQVDDVQLGAFLMLLRVKEESAEELAGFARACREWIAQAPSGGVVDLDWTSYAGKRRQPHWFLLAALLLAQAGFRIAMHGAKGHTEGRVYSEDMLGEINVQPANSVADAFQQLEDSNFTFLPIANFCKPLDDIIGLRPLFGLRSPVHTLCRLINPLQASATVQSVFHPSYMAGHHEAAQLLGERNAVVLKGEAGEVEYRPNATVKLLRLNEGRSQEIILPRRLTDKVESKPTASALLSLWQNGAVDEASEYGYHTVIGTVAIALLAIGRVESADAAFAEAETLWQNRDPHALVSKEL